MGGIEYPTNSAATKPEAYNTGGSAQKYHHQYNLLDTSDFIQKQRRHSFNVMAVDDVPAPPPPPHATNV